MSTRSAAFLGCALICSALLGDTALAASRIDVVDQKGIAVNGTDGKPLGVEQTRQAIVRGAKARGWRIQKDEPGKVTVKLRDGGSAMKTSFAVVLDLPYGAGAFDIRYVETEGLRAREDGSGRTVASSYRKRADRLIEAIVEAAKVVSLQPMPDTAAK